jgi:hypothetical protein
MDCVDSTRCVVFRNSNASTRDMLGFLRERTTGLEPATPSLRSGSEGLTQTDRHERKPKPQPMGHPLTVARRCPPARLPAPL